MLVKQRKGAFRIDKGAGAFLMTLYWYYYYFQILVFENSPGIERVVVSI
jgi:hypothetical protein